MKNKKIMLTGIVASIIMVCCFTVAVFAEILDNGTKVQPNSDLTYYLNVDYDGIDDNSNVSSDNATTNVTSDEIEVTDKLPEGLTYKGVVQTESGQIGAVKRGDNTSCSGYVVDGVNGIRYDENTRNISFKVKDLGAGCRLTVGIITTTPSVDDPNTIPVETRREFYNTFSAIEKDLTIVSNQVHVYIGDDDATKYKVEYEYTGDVPSNAPILPVSSEYVSGNSVNVFNNVTLAGYEFSGWTTTDVTVENSKFNMPNHNVKFVGSFTKKNSYKVQYEITSEKPDNYISPADEQYYENDIVNVDTLKNGDIVNGYKFLGWTTEDVNIDNNIFEMPNKDVKIIGSFERLKYKVTYAFQGSVIPDNSDRLLPEVKYYYPGEYVKLENPEEVEGYKFLGWYKKDNFKMPEEDVIIYGEWMVNNGVFEPTITKEIINKKDAYYIGDKVKFKIVVTNTSDYDINSVMIKENTELSTFITGDNYEVLSDHMVKIPTIKSKKDITIYAEYMVTKDSKETEINEVELLGALADNNYTLNTDKEYKASVEFKTIQQNKPKEHTSNPNTLDNIIKYIIVFVVTIVALVILGVLVIKNKVKK